MRILILLLLLLIAGAVLYAKREETGSGSTTTSMGAMPYSDFRFLWPILLSGIRQPDYT